MERLEEEQAVVAVFSGRLENTPREEERARRIYQ